MATRTATLFRVFPSSGVPIYRQVIDQVRLLVLSGRLPDGEFLPSVRSVASELEVNPMTVSKAYSLLEAEGLVERVRGLGMRVRAQSTTTSLETRMAQLEPLLREVAARAHQLALSRDEVMSVLGRLLGKPDVDG